MIIKNFIIRKFDQKYLNLEKSDRFGYFKILQHILSAFKEKKPGVCIIYQSWEILNFVDKKYQVGIGWLIFRGFWPFDLCMSENLEGLLSSQQ